MFSHDSAGGAAAPVPSDSRKLIAQALFREQIAHMSLSARFGGSEATKGVARLMHSALEKRREEIIAEAIK